MVWLVPFLVVASAVAWRFAGDAAGFAVSAGTLALALWAGLGARPSPGLQTVLAFLGAGIAILGLSEQWWPCELSCSAGEDYSTLFDWPVAVLAGVSLILLALVSLRARAGGGRCKLGRAGAWLLAGVSGYYCFLSVQLEMVCGHCLAVHTAVFSGAFVAWGGFGRALGGLLLAGVAATAMYTLYNPNWWEAEADEPAPVPITAPEDGGDPASSPRNPAENTGDPSATGPASSEVLDATLPLDRLNAEQRALADRIDRERRIGPDDAPFRIEFVHAFTCSHCSKQHAPAIGSVKKLTDAGQVQMILRHAVTRRNQDGGELIKLAFAAAARGTYDEFVDKAFATLRAPVKFGESVRGSRARRLLNRLEQTYDLDALRAIVDENPEVYQALLDEEVRCNEELEAGGELPQVYLLDEAGEVLMHDGGHEYRPSTIRNEAVRQAAQYERRAGSGN